MVTKTQPFDRRSDDRRHADLEIRLHAEERRGKLEASIAGDDLAGHSYNATEQRRKQDRRKQERRLGERRQVNLGPPPGIGERRFRPDPRGVVFLYIDDAI